MPVNAEIYYHLYEGGAGGEQPPLVLIHGAGGSHLYWPSEIRRLAGYRVYALDLPGHGKSAGRGQQSIAAYARHVIEWLQETGLHSAVFAGHSMGSAIALSLALDFPEHVLGLALVGAGARLRVAPQILESATSPTTFHSTVEMVVQASFSPEASPQLTELAARRMAETRQTVLHGDFVACNAFDVTERLCDVQQPAVVIVGSEDQMTRPRYAQYLADNMPQASLEVIPGAGHMVMLEQPQAVAEALVNFLRSAAF